jgi:hypothetical protein
MIPRLKIILVQITIGVILLEVGLRILDAIQPIESEPRVKIFHKQGKNYFLKPNIKFEEEVKGRKISISTNKFGMNWKDIENKKRNGVKRIGVYGDSFTFGLWASNKEKSFVGIVDQNISNDSIEVLNFGCPGYGFDNIFELMKVTVKEFELDIVVICSFNGSDLRDTYLGLNKTIINNGITTINDNVLDDKIPGYKENRTNVKNRIREYLYIYKYLSLIRGIYTAPKASNELHPSSNPMSYTYWSSLRDTEIKRVAIEKSEHILSEIEHHCFNENPNIELHFIAIPFKEQVYSENERNEKYDIYFPQNYLRDYCERNSIPFFDLTPGIRQYVKENDNEEIYDFSHFNDKGHAVTGKLISNYLKKDTTTDTL